MRRAGEHVAVELAQVGREVCDPVRTAHRVLTSIPLAPPDPVIDPDWLADWQAAGRQAGEAVAAALESGFSGARAVPQVWQSTPADGLLLVAASWPVRQLEAFAGPRTGVRVVGNRGANGIDGLIAHGVGCGAGPSGRGRRASPRAHRGPGVPARPQRPARRARRAAAGPRAGRPGQRRRRHLPPAGAGSTRVRRRLRATLRHAPRPRPGRRRRGCRRARRPGAHIGTSWPTSSAARSPRAACEWWSSTFPIGSARRSCSAGCGRSWRTGSPVISRRSPQEIRNRSRRTSRRQPDGRRCRPSAGRCRVGCSARWGP